MLLVGSFVCFTFERDTIDLDHSKLHWCSGCNVVEKFYWRLLGFALVERWRGKREREQGKPSFLSCF